MPDNGWQYDIPPKEEVDLEHLIMLESQEVCLGAWNGQSWYIEEFGFYGPDEVLAWKHIELPEPMPDQTIAERNPVKPPDNRPG